MSIKEQTNRIAPESIVGLEFATEPVACQKKKLCRVNKGYNLRDSSKLLGISNSSQRSQVSSNPSRHGDVQFSSTVPNRSTWDENDFQVQDITITKAVGVGIHGENNLVYVIVAPLNGQHLFNSDENKIREMVNLKDNQKENDAEEILSTSRDCNFVKSSSTKSTPRRVVFSDDITVHTLVRHNDVMDHNHILDDNDNIDNNNIRDNNDIIDDNDVVDCVERKEVNNRQIEQEDFNSKETSENSEISKFADKINERTSKVTLPAAVEPQCHDKNSKEIRSSSGILSMPQCQIIPTHLAECRKKPLHRLSLFTSINSKESGEHSSNNNNNTRDMIRTTKNHAQPKLHRLSRSKVSEHVASSSADHKLIVGVGPSGDLLQLFVTVDPRFTPDDIVVRTCASGYNIRVTSEEEDPRKRRVSDCSYESQHGPGLNETFVLPVPIDTERAVANLSEQGCLLFQAPMILRGYRTSMCLDTNTNSSLNRPSVNNNNNPGNVRISPDKRLQFIL